MPTLQELRDKRGTLIETARTIDRTAKTEKRSLTADESAKFDKIMSDSDGVATEIATLESDEKRSRFLADADDWEKRSRGSATRGGGGGGDVVAKIEGAAPTAGLGVSPADRVETRAADGTLREIRHRSIHGFERRIEVPENLRARQTENFSKAFSKFIAAGKAMVLNPDETRALSVGSDPDGGFLAAPMQVVAELIKFVDDATPMRGLVRVIPVQSGALSLGAPSLDTDMADADWTAEIATGTQDDTGPKFGRRELKPQPLAKRVKVSEKLMRSAIMRPETIVSERLAYAHARTYEKAMLTGTGANQPLGIFTAHNDGIPTTRDVSTSNTSTEITPDGLIEAKYTLKPQYFPRATWLFHRDGLKMIRKMKDANDQYLWQPGLQAGMVDRILDTPYVLSEFAPNTFTTGKYVGMIGDFSFYWWAEALGLRIQRLDELYAETNQIGFISRAEADGQPVLAEAFVRMKLG